MSNDRRLTYYLIAFLAMGMLAACGADEPDLAISDAWGRPSPQSASNAAFYMIIENNGRADDTLLRAESSACGQTMLHNSIIDDNGVMRMEHVDELAVPAGESLALAVGGYHVMCIDRQVDLTAGDEVAVTLHFAVSGSRQVQVVIQEE